MALIYDLVTCRKLQVKQMRVLVTRASMEISFSSILFEAKDYLYQLVA